MSEITHILSEILKEKVVKEAVQNQAIRTFVKTNLYPSADFSCATKTFRDFKFSKNRNTMEYFVDEADYSYEGERAKYVGNAFHSYLLGDNHIKGVMEKAGILVAKELPLKDESNHISSRIDAIVKIKEKFYVVELKSAKSWSLNEYSKECSPSKEHQKQLQLYFHLYDLHRKDAQIKALTGGVPITSGIILYEGKNDHKFLEFTMKKNQHIIDELLEWCRRIFSSLKKDKEPSVNFEPDSFECLFTCKSKYYQLCHGKEKNAKTEVEVPVDKNIWGYGEVKNLAKDPNFRN